VPELIESWQAASNCLARELCARICELDEATQHTSRQLRVVLSPLVEGAGFDQALGSNALTK